MKRVIFSVGILILLCWIIWFSDGRKQHSADRFDLEEPKSEAMAALDFWASQRAYPHPTMPGSRYYRAYEEEIKNPLKSIGHGLLDGWVNIGPGNVGGRTNALAVDPQNPNIVYAGSASGGLWKLTWVGTSYFWQTIDTGFPVLGVNAIAIDPRDSKRIYIGTGEVYGYQNSIGGLYIRTTRGSYGIGLLKSEDGGNSWKKSIDWTYNQERGVLALEIDPQNPDVVFAGTTEGVYRSKDCGETWEKVHSVLMAVDLTIDPEEPERVYVSCGNLNSPGSGVYRSLQGGDEGSWTKLEGGLPFSWSGKTLLDIYRASPNVIYADVADDFNTVGLYRSSDYGESWTCLTTIDYARYQGWFAHYVRVHPEDSTRVICGGVYYYTSMNGGRNLIYTAGMHVDHHAFANHPTDPDIVYFGNDGGVYRSMDGGQTFQSLNNGYVTTQFYNGFSSSISNPELALGGLQDNNTVMYTGSTMAWRRGLIGGDGAYTAISSDLDDVMYGSSQRLSIWKSTDGGNNWHQITTGISGNAVCFIAPFVLSPSHSDILYAGNDFVYKSMNQGASWQAMNSNSPLNGNAILSLAVSPTNPSVVFAATVPTPTQRAEVFASYDGGLTFTNVTHNLPDRYYVDIQISPANDQIAYIALSGFGSSHLFRTTDGGGSWIDVGQDLPDVPTSAIAIDPWSPEHIYVGNDLGVYLSTDGGESWQDFNDYLPTAVLVMDLSISFSNRKIRAVTHGNGVYQRSLVSATPVEDDLNSTAEPDFYLFPNYPNPFNPETSIQFSLPHASFVTLRIFNTWGQIVRTLAATTYEAGRHQIVWDGKDDTGIPVAGGCYFCQLQVDSYRKTIKMMLQK
jgi:photosystem II stability/assembly factor-like uncharacterized protein